jgi:hypothetical protein
MEDPQVIALQRRLQLLRQLPGDFRDLEPGSPLWMIWWNEYPGSQEMMAKWAHGPAVQLTSFDNLYDLVDTIEDAERQGCSFIETANAALLSFNKVLSFFSYNCRFRFLKEK